jgi:pyrroloquinoline quinone (PQQ) biosynthesis protein C
MVSSSGNGLPVFALDFVRLETDTSPGAPLLARVDQTVDLKAIAPIIDAEFALEIVEEQYDACLDFMYSHPMWERIRTGAGLRELLGYVLESRHYLHAAASRMAPGVAAGWPTLGTTHALAEHAVEEADHAIFFENGLELLGCDGNAVRAARPAPATLEWIQLMRGLASRGPLVAGLCSGLMESSGADKNSIRGWHERVVELGLLSQDVVDAFYEHIKLDMELGHGANWREVIEHEAPLAPAHLAQALNAVCTVAEMLYRWFEMLRRGLVADVVALTSQLTASLPGGSLGTSDFAFAGSPVWSAEVLHKLTYGADEPEGARAAIALAYHFDDRVKGAELGSDLTDRSAELLRAAASARPEAGAEPEQVASEWRCAIEGHRLWSAMTDKPTFALVYGWLLENYHYLVVSPRHVAAAVAACPDRVLRDLLVEHLADEAEHGEILLNGLTSVEHPVAPDRCRPLPTTVAFIAYLKELGALDWKAYCVALGFLQFTLTGSDTRPGRFYEAVVAGCPRAQPLVNAMSEHDRVDQAEGHGEKMRQLLSALQERHEITEETFARAAVLPQLAWSFLDGIRTHYGQGEAAIAQRIGWFASRV